MLATNVLFAAIVLVGAMGAPVCRAQIDAGKTGVPETGFPDLGPIMDEVARLRGLPFKRPVPAQIQDQAGWGEFLSVEIDKAYPPDERDAMVRGLVKLGMLSEAIDFGEQLETALLTQAGAYYDPATGHFYYLMVEMPEDQLAVLASHELTHALQDQHFDLDAMMTEVMPAAGEVRNDDAGLALSALIEGEATYVMTLWQADQVGRDLTANARREAVAISMMSEMSMDMMVVMAQAAGAVYGEDSDIGKAMGAMEDIPLYILEPLYAAYMKGAFFTMSVRQAGEEGVAGKAGNGWEAVSEAYANPPRSSEQILHPDKYTGGADGMLRDDPTALRLPVFASLEEQGYRPIDEAVHGELYLGMLLRNFDVNFYEVASAVEGWDGDVYRALQSPQGEVAIVLATTWDSEKDAHEFADAYRKALARKYPQSQARAWGGGGGGGEEVGSENRRTLGGDGGEGGDGEVYADTQTEEIVRGRRIEGTMTTRGREVFIVEGLTRDQTAGVMQQLLAMPIERVK
jgi:hypothetical protein